MAHRFGGFNHYSPHRRYYDPISPHLRTFSRSQIRNIQRVSYNRGRRSGLNFVDPQTNHYDFAYRTQRTQGWFDIIKTGVIAVVTLALGIPLLKNIFNGGGLFGGSNVSVTNGGSKGGSSGGVNGGGGAGGSLASAKAKLAKLENQLKAEEQHEDKLKEQEKKLKKFITSSNFQELGTTRQQAVRDNFTTVKGEVAASKIKIDALKTEIKAAKELVKTAEAEAEADALLAN